MAKEAAELVAAGTDALGRRDYETARRLFEAALEIQVSPEALEGLGMAAYWLDDAPAMFDARERAYLAFREGGDFAGAARLATYLAWDYVAFRGEAAVANGWCRRAHRLLDGTDTRWEHGWLAVRESSIALFDAGDVERAWELASRAVEVGRALYAQDIEMCGVGLQGLALVSQGRIEEGMPLLDEAAVAAAAGELSDLMAGLAGCYLMFACGRIRDYERAIQWCQRLEEFAERRGMRAFFSVCKTQHADVLIWRGAWREADEELARATRDLKDLRPGQASEGVVRIAELRRRQGKLKEARALLDEAGGHPLATLGRAELALDEGRPGTAAQLADRYLRHLPQADRVERAPALEILARARAAGADPAGAAQPLEELDEIARMMGTGPLRASAAFAAGIVSMSAGDLQLARTQLEDSVDLYRRNGAQFETARAQLALAEALLALGSRDEAIEEARSAIERLHDIGAVHQATRAETFLSRIAPSSRSGRRRGLTDRELEILALVAQGLSNREIATRLVLSQHTVHRHVANALTKLGVSSRAAATAYAVEHDLV